MPWSRADIIALMGVIGTFVGIAVAILSNIVTIAQPEIRNGLGLGRSAAPPGDTQQRYDQAMQGLEDARRERMESERALQEARRRR